MVEARGIAPRSQRKSGQPSYSNFVIFRQEDQFEENDARLVSSCHNRLRGLWGSTAINVRFRVLGDYPHHSLALITVSAVLVFPPSRGL